jgi:hypothetical protein
MGHADPGKGLALDDGGEVMWWIPLSLTLNVRKTRTGWSMTVRIHFIT